jgi:hypothetical protein
MSARAATLLALGFLVAASVSRAQDATATESPPAVPQAGNPGAVVDLGTVVVSGVQPGPGLWPVSKGDHVLYILGTQSPLPRDMTWRADELRQVLGEAGAVLGPPGVTIGADIGFFRGLTLMPSALKAMKNPDGATLDEVLPPDIYQRWSMLRQRLSRPRQGRRKEAAADRRVRAVSGRPGAQRPQAGWRGRAGHRPGAEAAWPRRLRPCSI